MSYLVGQILLCLLLASVLGLVLGWLARRLRDRSDMDRLNTALHRQALKLENSEQHRSVLQNSIKELQYAYRKDQEQSRLRIQQLEPYQSEAAWLRQELNNSKAADKAEIERLCKQLKALEPLAYEIKVNETVIERLQSQLRTQAEAKEGQVQQLKTRLEELESIHVVLQKENETLLTSVQQQTEVSGMLQKKLQQLQGQANSEVRVLHRRLMDQQILQQQVREQQCIIDDLTKSRHEQNTRKTPAVAARAPTAVSTQTRSEARKNHRPGELRSQEKDDLKRIRGIGPVMERTLNDIGITSFKQIANFSKQDIQRVKAAIDVFPDRIVRDDWVGGARIEYEKKYGHSR